MTEEEMKDDATDPSASEESSKSEEEIEFDLEVSIEDEADDGVLDQAMRDALNAVEQIESREGAAVRGIAPVPGVGLSTEEPDVEALQAEIADLKDRSVRTLADFDNYRKRVERERQEERRYSGTEMLRDFLGVVDNMERALLSTGSVEDLKQGVEMIFRQLQELLKTHGVCSVKADGERFDPAVHDAVSQVFSEDAQVPMVDSVLQSGYRLHDRLLRPAMVVVAMPQPAAVSEETDSTEAEDQTETDGGEG